MYFARTLSNCLPSAFWCCARDPEEDSADTEANKAKVVAKKALNSACEAPEGTIPDEPGEHLIQPWKVNAWKDGLASLATFGVSATTAAYMGGLLLSSYGITPEVAGPVAGATYALVSVVISSTPFSQNSIGIEGVRIMFTQMTTQALATYVWRLGLEEAASYVNPALRGHYETQGNTTLQGNMTMPGNGTDVYGMHPQAMQHDWYSLVVVGVPCLIQMSALVFPPLRAMSGFDTFINRIRFDGSKEAVIDRFDGPRGDGRVGRTRALLASAALKLAVGCIAVGLPVGLGLTGRMATAHRLVVGWSASLCAARMRDFMNTALKGVFPGGIVDFQRKDDGLFRQKEVKIPQPVLDKLLDACTNMKKFKEALNFAKLNRLAQAKQKIREFKAQNGGISREEKSEILSSMELTEEMISVIRENFVDREMYDKALNFLHDEYRDLFLDARFYSSFIYALASYAGLCVAREYNSSSGMETVFAPKPKKLLDTTLLYIGGTAAVEGLEEPSHLVMIRALATLRGMPFSISNGSKDKVDQIATNLSKLSFTSPLTFVPFQPLLRSTSARYYQPSQVTSEGKFAVSHSDLEELNAWARSFQNMVHPIFYNLATMLDDSRWLWGAVLVNWITHARGPMFVSQVLLPGLENARLFEYQQKHLSCVN